MLVLLLGKRLDASVAHRSVSSLLWWWWAFRDNVFYTAFSKAASGVVNLIPTDAEPQPNPGVASGWLSGDDLTNRGLAATREEDRASFTWLLKDNIFHPSVGCETKRVPQSFSRYLWPPRRFATCHFGLLMFWLFSLFSSQCCGWLHTMTCPELSGAPVNN